MTLYLLKPVVWNTQGYVRPAGYGSQDSHPATHGFGHEEWNNAPAMATIEDGRAVRYFHTEKPGNAAVDDYLGDTVVFMVASHHGRQDLVGVGGRAEAFFSRPDRRAEIAASLDLASLEKEVWALSSARAVWKDHAAFKAYWDENVSWIPVWRSPQTHYFVPRAPVALDASRITGKLRLPGRFKGHRELSLKEARAILLSVPGDFRTRAWSNIFEDLEYGPDEGTPELQAILHDPKRSRTVRRRLVDARLGQGRFRSELDRRWGSACCVTGCAVRDTLRASHIRPWAGATDNERLDPANGLLLVATLDCLFDKRLISFDEDGEMQISELLTKADRKALGLPQPLRRAPDQDERRYLARHLVR